MKDKKINIAEHINIFTIVIIFIVISSIAMFFSSISLLQRNYKLQTQISLDKQSNEYNRLYNENLKLQQKYLTTDEFFELEARTKLNKAKPGEHLVLLPKTNEKNETTIAVENPHAATKTNFQLWVKFIFGVSL